MITRMPRTATENHAPTEGEALNRRPILLAVAVATAGVLPVFLTGGLAVQMRGELGFGAAALGLAVAAFFAIVKTNPGAPAAATGITQTGASGGAALGPLVFGLVVEATSYDVAWLVSGAIALAALAAILVGRSMLLRARMAVSG